MRVGSPSHESTVHSLISTGTYFGPKSEYDALGFQDKLAQNAVVKVVEMVDWLGSVGHWAEDEALKLVGGIVSRHLS